MIDAWRQQWNKNFPFYFVQIAPLLTDLKMLVLYSGKRKPEPQHIPTQEWWSLPT
jgi:hypothetical protein